MQENQKEIIIMRINRLVLAVTIVIAILLVAVCVLGYNLYQEHKWANIYFQHMMEAKQQLEQAKGRVVNFINLPDDNYKKQDARNIGEDFVFLTNEREMIFCAFAPRSEVPENFTLQDGKFLEANGDAWNLRDPNELQQKGITIPNPLSIEK